MSKRTYYTIVTRDDATSPWGVAFGAWEHDDVIFEADLYREDGVKARDLKILKSDGRQESIDAMVEALNTPTRTLSEVAADKSWSF